MKNSENGINKKYDVTAQAVVEEGVSKVSNKMKESVVTLDPKEIRFLVDAYYQKQDDRKAKFNQLRSLQNGQDTAANNNQVTMLQWLAENSEKEEKEIKKLLDVWTDNQPVGRWIKSVVGLGPVFAAALMAYFDVSKCSHYNQFMAYAGLNDYNVEWLGSTKASKVVSEVFKEIQPKLKKVVEVFIEPVPEKKRNAFVQLIKRMAKKLNDDEIIQVLYALRGDDMDVEDDEKFEIMSSYLEKLEGYGILNDESYEKMVNVYNEEFGTDYEEPEIFYISVIAYIYDKDAVTWENVTEVCRRTNRKPDRIMERLDSVAETKKEKKPRFYTEDDLASLMARPPYNPKLKVIMYLIGDSFVKRSNHPDSLYGKIYKQRKVEEEQKNENGVLRKRAERALAGKNYRNKEVRETYESGRLPKGHIDRRARRYAESIFLSHLFEVMYMDYYHTAPPVIYPIAHQGHVDYIPPEVPYDQFVKVPQEYYDNYPWIYEGAPKIDENPDYYRNDPKFAHIVELYEQRVANDELNN